MAIENCEQCKAYGFTCNRGGFLQRMACRAKIVTMNDNGQQFAHNFTIETCEVVTGEVSAKEYASLLKKYVAARNAGLIYPL